MTLNNVICKFPDEMVSNDTKKGFDFAQKFGSAIWSEWEFKFDKRYSQIQINRSYAKGEQNIDAYNDEQLLVDYLNGEISVRYFSKVKNTSKTENETNALMTAIFSDNKTFGMLDNMKL